MSGRARRLRGRQDPLRTARNRRRTPLSSPRAARRGSLSKRLWVARFVPRLCPLAEHRSRRPGDGRLPTSCKIPGFTSAGVAKRHTQRTQNPPGKPMGVRIPPPAPSVDIARNTGEYSGVLLDVSAFVHTVNQYLCLVIGPDAWPAIADAPAKQALPITQAFPVARFARPVTKWRP